MTISDSKLRLTAIVTGLCTAIATGLLGPAPTVQASSTYISGNVCRSYNPTQVTDIVHRLDGIINIATSPRNIVCPLSSVYVNGTSPGRMIVVGRSDNPADSITCTLYASDINGNMLASSTVKIEYPQFYQTTSTRWAFAFLTMVCKLPGNQSSVLNGVVMPS